MKIREFRSVRGLRQEDLAEATGVTQAAVSEWESGKSRPATDKLVKLAAVLGVTVDALLSDAQPAASAPEQSPATEREPNGSQAA